MIVADASYLIALGDPTDLHHAAATQVRAAIEERVVLLHPLTLAECLVGPSVLGRLHEAEDALRRATDVVAFDPDSPVRLATLGAASRLRMPDAIVLDTAVAHDAAIVTFDDRLAVVARGLGLEVHGAPEPPAPSPTSAR